MATLPKARTVTYEEWLRMPVVQNGREEVVNGEIRILRSAILAEGVLKPKHFPVVQIDISQIWSD